MPEHTQRLSHFEQEQLGELKIIEEPEQRVAKNGSRIIRQFVQYQEYGSETRPVLIADMYYDKAEGEDVEVTNPFQYINKETLEIDPGAPKDIKGRLSTQIIQYEYTENGSRIENGKKREKDRLYHREYLKDCHAKIDLVVGGKTITDARVDVLEIGFCPRYDGVDGHHNSDGKMESTDPETLEALKNITWSRSGTKQDGSKWAEKKGDKVNMAGDGTEITVRGKKILITSIKQLNLDTDTEGKPTKAFFQGIEWEYVEKPKKEKE